MYSFEVALLLEYQRNGISQPAASRNLQCLLMCQYFSANMLADKFCRTPMFVLLN